ncbi:MAG: hypothetical protein K0R34_1167 [Herbinix sp.]|jgi:hypothetical protein|nr:hypothetical protein [Herbinix sp.]
MKTKKSILIIITLGIILFPIFLFFLGKSFPSSGWIYEMNWNINIPKDFKLIYQKLDKHDFQGKGIRYTLFETKETVSFPLIIMANHQEIRTKNGNSQSNGNNIIEDSFQQITTDLSISVGYCPKLDSYYEWQQFVKNGSSLVVIYELGTGRIFFAERLM